MNRKYAVRFVAILVVFCLSIQSAEAARLCARIFQAQVQSIDQLLKGEDRPSADDLMSFSEADKRSFFAKTPKPDEPQVFSVIADVAREVVHNWDGRPIILLGRDSELVFDALQYLFFTSGTPISVSSRVHLVTLSRPMMENSNFTQLRAYFKKYANVDFAEVLKGGEKIRIFDTGNRGTIYLKLLQLFLGQIKNGDTKWKTKILNVLEFNDFLLLATEDSSTMPDVINKIKAMKEFNRASLFDLFDKEQDELYFPQLRVRYSEKNRNLPTNLDNRYDWVVNNIEYKPHWEGRTLGLSPTGKNRLLPLEADRRVNKSQYLARQIALFDYMENSPEVQDILEEFAKKAGRTFIRPKQPKVAIAIADPVPKFDAVPNAYPDVSWAIKRDQAPAPRPVRQPPPAAAVQGQTIEIGKTYARGEVVLLNGQAFTIESKVRTGSLGVYYEVRGNDQTSYLLRIAKYNDEETLEIFNREKRKEAGYVQARAPHASLVADGPTWVLKNFVAGPRADEWLNDWDWSRSPSGGPRMEALVRFLKSMAARGVYIGDLSPTGLVWNNNQWVIVDSGGARLDYGESKTLKRYYEKIKDRWYEYFPSREARKAFKEALGNGLLGRSE